MGGSLGSSDFLLIYLRATVFYLLSFLLTVSDDVITKLDKLWMSLSVM